MQITISYFVQLVMLLWITTESQFLTNTFQLFHTSNEWINQPSSKRAKQQTLKTSFKCKTSAHEEKVKVCHEWKEREIRLV